MIAKLPTADEAVKLQQQRESHRIAPHFHQQAEVARKRAAEKQERINQILIHIARRYNYHHEFTRPGRAANTWHIGKGYPGDSDWHSYTRNMRRLKWSPGSNGVRIEGDRIILTGTDGRRAELPVPPAALTPHISLTEPHPLGYFCVPVKSQTGVFANFGLADDCVREHPDLPITDPRARWVNKQKWVVVGFSVRGRVVPECVARGTVTLADIERETNTETRQVMIERFGIERYLREVGAAELDHSDFGTLYDIHGMKVVKVINATPEPDGSYKDYFLRVPPEMTSSRAAVAWTFGLQADEYEPAVQS